MILTVKRVFILLLGVVVLTSPAAAASDLAKELDPLLEQKMGKYGIPGLSVAIAREGEIIYSGAFGEGIDRETRFYLGSVTKSFTALAVMQLVEEGKVNLDEPVSTYISQFRLSDEITVGHLLHHTSGMTEYDYMPFLPPDADYGELVEDLDGIKLRYQPGTRFSYFNPNYCLLGMLIEEVSGSSFTDYLEDNIFKPLGLDQTSARGEVDTSGHISMFGVTFPRHEPLVKYRLPSGYLTSTGEDLVRYMEKLRARGPELGVSPQVVDLMQTGEPYGMGWVIGRQGGRPDIFHVGSLPGFRTEAIMLSAEGYSIAILTNKNHILYSFYAFPRLVETIVALLLEQEQPGDLPLPWIMRGLFVIFLAVTTAGVIRWKRLILEPRRMTAKGRLVAVGLNLAILLMVIYMIPVAVKVFSQRGFTWRLAILQAPDVVLIILVVLLFAFGETGYHLLQIFISRGGEGKGSSR